MRIKKVSQTTPVQAKIVDGYSTSSTDGYSANYVNSITADNDWTPITTNYGTINYRKIADNTYHLLGNVSGFTETIYIPLPFTPKKQHVFLLGGSATYYTKGFINGGTGTLGITAGNGASSTIYTVNTIISTV